MILRTVCLLLTPEVLEVIVNSTVAGPVSFIKFRFRGVLMY